MILVFIFGTSARIKQRPTVVSVTNKPSPCFVSLSPPPENAPPVSHLSVQPTASVFNVVTRKSNTISLLPKPPTLLKSHHIWFS
ncbi:hypothetical protein AALP_AA5G196400 [Arabis alpina]|uniref:Uncharacterized protein n=1 Tax=Arabis alpina TaxID=50452 RepID=A0A087GY60_ARAAL|nr:hypothetical protein AALP_AA5G196400 [Arabis alpina]